MAYNHNPNNGTTTGIILQAHEGEMKTFKEQIIFHKSFTSHRLLLSTIITEMSLKKSEEQTSEVKQNVMDIEHSTGQHTWDDYIARDKKPKPDVELSKEVHGFKIQAAVIYRRIEAVSIWTELLLESLTQDQEDSAIKTSVLQWVRNLKIQVKMAKLDVELLTKRAEIQVGAVYNRFAQRDNITTQKISEATNRDSSAMKSLAVLGAIFFPGTFVATLFAMESLKDQPFWMYWVVTAPLTFVVLGTWTFWTYWRSESVRQQEMKLDEKDIA